MNTSPQAGERAYVLFHCCHIYHNCVCLFFFLYLYGHFVYFVFDWARVFCFEDEEQYFTLRTCTFNNVLTAKQNLSSFAEKSNLCMQS